MGFLPPEVIGLLLGMAVVAMVVVVIGGSYAVYRLALTQLAGP